MLKDIQNIIAAHHDGMTTQQEAHSRIIFRLCDAKHHTGGDKEGCFIDEQDAADFGKLAAAIAAIA